MNRAIAFTARRSRVPVPGRLLALLAVGAVSCGDSSQVPGPLTARVPLHLEEHLEEAAIEGSQVPGESSPSVQWDFTHPQPEWKAALPVAGSRGPIEMRRKSDGLRLELTEANRLSLSGNSRHYSGGVYVDVPGWTLDDWAYVSVRARTGGVTWMELGFNLSREPGTGPDEDSPFLHAGHYLELMQGEEAQTYLLRAEVPSGPGGSWKGPWRQLGIRVGGPEPGTLDLISVSVIPREAEFASTRVGVRAELRGNTLRRSLYTHAPSTLEFPVDVPEGGRLDVGLGVLRGDKPVTFTVAARAGERRVILFEESCADPDGWAQRSIDLSALAGQTVFLSLETSAQDPGAVAFWAAPTLTGQRRTTLPNIVFYIIDAAAADYMSAFGYNRGTTPHLERLAEEGALFERAYSNSSWSKSSTPSFMTSLQHSVLGGYLSDSDPLPDQVKTMAQYLHRNGYQTGVMVSNPYAGSMSSLERGVDRMRETGVEPNTISSEHLQKDFWAWRSEYPGEPYWVHFQTTDVHWPWKPPAPFAGLFVSAAQRTEYYEWERQLAAAAGLSGPSWLTPALYPPAAFQETGIDRFTFFNTARGLYDEAMAHNDYQIGQLVRRLKERGEWENTLFIVASDHGNGHALGLFDRLPPRGPILRSPTIHVPLIMVWPGHIVPGKRFREPVSMIDMLPTILELGGLPGPDPTQGRSLAPLLEGRAGWEPRPVILEEFYVHPPSGRMYGAISAIDGRWGASLVPIPIPEEVSKRLPVRPSPLLLYDLWNDPLCRDSLHEEQPRLVRKYTDFLRSQFQLSQVLGESFTRSRGRSLDPEQLRTLRSLGYVQ